MIDRGQYIAIYPKMNNSIEIEMTTGRIFAEVNQFVDSRGLSIIDLVI